MGIRCILITINDNSSAYFTDINKHLISQICVCCVFQEKKRREKQEAMRVLTELKSVISVRAVEVNKREEAALRKMYPDLHNLTPKENVAEISNDVSADDRKLMVNDSKENRDSTQINETQCVDNTGEYRDKTHSENMAYGNEIKDDSEGLTSELPSTGINFHNSEEGNKSTVDNQKDKNHCGTETIEADMNNECVSAYVNSSDCFPSIDSAIQSEQNKIIKDFVQEPTPTDEKQYLNTDWSLDNDVSENISEQATEMENHTKNTDTDENWTSDKHRNCKSYVTSVGVRRLRKSNLLELCDSESDEDQDNRLDYYYNDIDNPDDGIETEKPERIGLPLLELIGNKINTYEHDEKERDEDDSDGDDNIVRMRLPMLSLEDRLQRFGGSAFGFSTEVATEAVERSKVFGQMEEETFGGEVYGELSEEEHDSERDSEGDKGSKQETVDIEQH